MSTESREYPMRIWAGHLGGGRRIWKPELMHESEKAFACEYVRADANADMLAALTGVLALIEDIDGAEHDDAPELVAARAAIAKAEGRS